MAYTDIQLIKPPPPFTFNIALSRNFIKMDITAKTHY